MANLMAYLTFECALCKETVTEPNNDEIEIAEFYRDFPEYAGKTSPEKLKRVCVRCYGLIKDVLGVKGGHTIQ